MQCKRDCSPACSDAVFFTASVEAELLANAAVFVCAGDIDLADIRIFLICAGACVSCDSEGKMCTRAQLCAFCHGDGDLLTDSTFIIQERVRNTEEFLFECIGIADYAA